MFLDAARSKSTSVTGTTSRLAAKGVTKIDKVFHNFQYVNIVQNSHISSLQ